VLADSADLAVEELTGTRPHEPLTVSGLLGLEWWKEDRVERDVVCGMQVDPAKAAATSEYQEKTYYFCAKACKVKFDANPAQYVK